MTVKKPAKKGAPTPPKFPPRSRPQERGKATIDVPFFPVTVEYDRNEDSLFIRFRDDLEINYSDGCPIREGVTREYHMDKKRRLHLIGVEILEASRHTDTPLPKYAEERKRARALLRRRKPRNELEGLLYAAIEENLDREDAALAEKERRRSKAAKQAAKRQAVTPSPHNLVREVRGGSIYEYYPVGKYVVIAPGVCGGRPTVKGHRLDARWVLGSVKSGKSAAQVARDYKIPVAAVKEVIALQDALDYEQNYTPSRKKLRPKRAVKTVKTGRSAKAAKSPK